MKTGSIRISTLAAGALSALLLMGSAQPASAQIWGDCRDRMERAEMRLDRAINRFGPRSFEARAARARLADVRASCWRLRHGWWDPRGRAWRTDHW